MNYTLNTSGKQVMLNVLANADMSIVGIQVGNSRIISMQESELSAIVLGVYGDMMSYHLFRTLAKYHVIKPREDGTNEPLIVMETIEDNGMPVDYRRILDLLKLYKSADIFSCYTTYYKIEQEKIKHCNRGEILMFEHPIYWPNKPYTMTVDECEQFDHWWETHKDIFDENSNSKFKRILRMYLDAFMMMDAETSFVVLSVVLEMLFGAPNGELTYRISRGAALFLSSDRSEMRNIHSQIKKLYNIRSKYVHEGRNIDWEKLFELREIIRKIIIFMYERGMNKSDFNFKKFAEELSFDGYVKEAVAIAKSDN